MCEDLIMPLHKYRKLKKYVSGRNPPTSGTPLGTILETDYGMTNEYSAKSPPRVVGGKRRVSAQGLFNSKFEGWTF